MSISFSQRHESRQPDLQNAIAGEMTIQDNLFWGNEEANHRLQRCRSRPSPRRQAKFREALVKARQAAGLTQAALGKKLGHPQSFASKVERGERRLDVVEFLDVAKALRLDPCQVLTDLDG